MIDSASKHLGASFQPFLWCTQVLSTSGLRISLTLLMMP